jgi:hypothetical protein
MELSQIIMCVKKLLSFSLLAAVTFGAESARSQVTLDHLLGAVNVNGSLTCGTVDIRLNRPVSITSSTPLASGTDLMIKLEPLATTLPSTDPNNLKEAASVAPGNVANLAAVVFDPAATTGPVIRIVFSKPMAFRVVRDENSRHVKLDVSPLANSEKCLGKAITFDESAPKPDEAAKTDAPAPTNDGPGALKEGKKFLAAGDYGRATAFFTKAVTIGTGATKQEAQEMLGLARERAGQMAFARSEYETYLKQYPGGPSAARVKDRLDGIVAAMETEANKQFALRQAQRAPDASGPVSNAQDKGNKNALGQSSAVPNPSNPGQSSTLSVTDRGIKSNLRDIAPDPKAWLWERHGSLAQYYYRDDNFVPSVQGSPTLDVHRVYQNEILSSGDFYIRGENEDYAVEANASAYNEKGFGDQNNINASNLSTAYVDAKLKKTHIGARLGRQSKSTGGVFGRFDGGVVTWEPIKDLKAQIVAGSPVYSRVALPFADSRYFYGASLDYTLPSKEWAGGIYAIQQEVNSIVDRRAVGAELRYNGKKLSVYSAADYDIFFMQLNNAYVSGTWNPREGTSVYGTADYRRVPFLLTSNALTGQNFTNLSTLVDAVGNSNVNQWATDRTASSETITIGASQQVFKDWQIALDATVAKYSGTPASGGVDEIPDPGIEYYLSAQMSGSSIFKENDSVSFGLRYSASKTSAMYMADATFRYPVNEKLRIGPRVRVSLRDSKNNNQKQYLVMPSFSARYRLDKKWSFETEIGGRWQDTVTAIDSNQTLDILATAGYRFEF